MRSPDFSIIRYYESSVATSPPLPPVDLRERVGVLPEDMTPEEVYLDN